MKLSFIRRIVLQVFAIGIMTAVLLVVSQRPFADSRFEFQQEHEHTGTLREFPYPALATDQTRFLLVDPGKIGAAATLKGLDGKRIRLQGALIERGPNSMLEILPGSIQPDPSSAPAAAETALDIGPADFTGEIVDSKCFLGVMNPGAGKVHRACAASCIRGGVPPAFLVHDAGGNPRVFLLTGSDGRPLRDDVMPFVAEPIHVTGRMARLGTQYILKAEPETFRRLE